MYVIFDTNAYRSIATGKSRDDILNIVQEINQMEERKNIKSLADIIVCQELIEHLASPDDKYYSICLNALIALHEHCKVSDQKGL